MSSSEIEFLSLFVPDLKAAQRMYADVFDTEPVLDDEVTIHDHPCSSTRPVVFRLGSIRLALYQADMKTTHPGDVGIGVQISGDLAQLCERVQRNRGRVFIGPQPVGPDAQGRQLAVFVLPDRHFFEAVSTHVGHPNGGDS